MTLRPLLTRLGIEDDGTVEREVRLARVETLRAAMTATEAASGTETAALVKRRYEVLLRRAESGARVERRQRAGGRPDAADQRSRYGDADMVRAAMAAERQQLSALRADGTIGDAAFQQIEEELDWAELDVQQLLRSE